ncbi:MAG: hypothetical protein JSS02_16170 [Planctomycetes bacterium]|nr:hypothetical protein [Planctomycetota bacterium]
MSEPFFLPDPDDDDADVCQTASTRREKRTLWFVLGTCTLGVVCLCSGMGYLFVSEVVKGFREASARNATQTTEFPVPMPPLEVELRAQRLADLQTGFSSDPLIVDPAIREGVEVLLKQIIAATSQQDDAAFRALVNPQRFMLEVKKRGILNILYPQAEQQHVESFRSDWITCPASWDRYWLANVRLQGRGDEALLYVYAWEGNSSATEIRLWVTRAEGAWKIYDWEILDIGIRRSLVASLAIVSSTRPEVTENFKSLRMLSEAIDLGEQGDSAGALARVEEAAKLRVVHELADETYVTRAYVWRNLGRPHEALKAARQVQQPDYASGAYYVQGLIYHKYGLYRKALDFARRYETAIGGGPPSYELLAAVLEGLGERAESIAYRQKYLRIDPENMFQLSALANAVDSQQAAGLMAAVQRTSQPVEVAEQLALGARYRNPTIVPMLVHLVVQSEPDSARSAFLQGFQAEITGERDQAARSYKLAIDRSTPGESQTTYIQAYLDVMAVQNRVAEAYAEMPDPQAAFRHLVMNDSDEAPPLSDEVLRALCEQHAVRYPDDPWLHYQQGLQYKGEGQTERACEAFKTAIRHADGDEDLDTFRTVLFVTLKEAGQWQAAYEDVFPVDLAFPKLVASESLNEERAGFEDIVSRHTATHPADPWLQIHAAMQKQRGGEFAEAQRLLRECYRSTDDALVHMNCRQRLLEIVGETGQTADLYETSESPDQALRDLVVQIRRRDTKLSVPSVLAEYQQKFPTSKIWQRLQADSCWATQDFAGFLTAIGPNLEDYLQGMSTWERDTLASNYVRCLWHVGRTNDARRLSETLCYDWGEPQGLQFVLVQQKSLAELQVLFREFGKDSWRLQSAYRSADIGPELRTPQFLPVRQEFPPLLGQGGPLCELVLLFDEAPALTQDQFVEEVRRVWGESATVTAVSEPEGLPAHGVSDRWLVTFGANRLMVLRGSGLYFQESSTSATSTDHRELMNIRQRQQGWLGFYALDSNAPQTPELAAEKSVGQLAARFLSPRVLGVNLPQLYSLVPTSPALAECLTSANPFQTLRARGTFHITPSRVSDAFDLSADLPRNVQFQRSLDKLKKLFDSRTPEQQFEIVALKMDSDLVELVRLRLTDIREFRPGAVDYMGEVRGESRLWPHLRDGEPRLTNAAELVEWSITTDGQTQRTTRW